MIGVSPRNGLRVSFDLVKVFRIRQQRCELDLMLGLGRGFLRQKIQRGKGLFRSEPLLCTPHQSANGE